MFVLDLINALQARWAKIVATKVYVDDLTLSVTSLPQVVIRVLAQAIDFAAHVLEDAMLMLVSGKNFKVVASKPSVAQKATSSDRTSCTRVAKLLGTDTVGGTRRSTLGCGKRLSDFSHNIHRYKALRQFGVNTTLMARIPGVLAIMYGCEVMGLSDSCLRDARAKIAKAASPATSGRNATLTLALDGSSGTLDPAFEAHVAPLRHWATALWDNWFTTDLMQHTLGAARRKFANTKGSWWSVVAGPTIALLATIRRIGWKCHNATTLITDEGQSLSLILWWLWPPLQSRLSEG